MLSWEEFHDKYTVRATVKGETELFFALYDSPLSYRTNVTNVFYATVYEKTTGKNVKHYEFAGTTNEVSLLGHRSNGEILKQLIIKDFQIDENKNYGPKINHLPVIDCDNLTV